MGDHFTIAQGVKFWCDATESFRLIRTRLTLNGFLSAGVSWAEQNALHQQIVDREREAGVGPWAEADLAAWEPFANPAHDEACHRVFAEASRQLCGHILTSQAALVRDIFPFHPITIHPSWLTSTVLSLAQGMYDSRDFGAMPILADALQDAGCDEEAILMHCRGGWPHCRGCFWVDALLSKS